MVIDNNYDLEREKMIPVKSSKILMESAQFDANTLENKPSKKIEKTEIRVTRQKKEESKVSLIGWFLFLEVSNVISSVLGINPTNSKNVFWPRESIHLKILSVLYWQYLKE